ncbi:MAG: hypothetical protein NMNS01_11700 [Nitrosomonas sp.]|nr:MAG: hypothetical protein NMNS01_11700 [Nitrosomonas sp.]
MRIQKITIRNFRSIEHAEVCPENFNFFVGQNNHGKTNFFDAIDFFYNGIARGQTLDEIRFNHDSSKDVEVSVEFSDLQDGLASMKNQKHQTTIENFLGENQTITLSRKNDGKFQITVGGKTLERNPTGIDAALKDFLPRLEYVKTKKYFDDVGKFDKKTPIGIMLSGVLEAVIEKNEEYRQLKEKFSELFEGEDSEVSTELKNLSGSVEIYLKKQFPDCNSVRFEISPPQFSEYLKNFETHVDDGVETAVSDKGDGMQRALMLAIIQAYADHRKQGEDTGKSFVFLIDEAELHLHPSAQRKLKHALFEISSRGDQIFVNTHSSVLITENFEHQKIFKVEKIEKVTSVSSIVDEVERQNIIYDLLGGAPTDLLLPPNFLIVEGNAEQVFLDRIMQRFYSDKPSVKVISAEGFASQAGRVVGAISKLYAPLTPVYEDRVVILLDAPNSGNNLATYTDFREHYTKITSSGRLFTLPTECLEDYYPDHLIVKRSRGAKVKLAKHVSNKIDKIKFEGHMSVMYQALQKAWNLSYGAEDQKQAAA